MGWGTGNIGGGSGGLNFKIVGGTKEPANPKENTIWVNTSVEINRWEILDPSIGINNSWGSEGDVYIHSSTIPNSDASFNAVKKNVLHLSPSAAKQKINGAYANVEANIYKNGEWVTFSYTYVDPNITLIPNASHANLWAVGVQGDGYNEHTISQNAIYAKRGYKGRITIQTKKKQQLYDKNTITVNVTGYKDLGSSYGSHAYVYIATVADPATPSYLVSSKEITGNGAHSLTIGAGGEYYVGLMLYFEQATSNWRQDYLELTLTSMKIN